MRISQYSIIQFDITFVIPRNNLFSYILITDDLVNGLSYTPNTASIYLDGVKQTSDFIDNSISNKLNLRLNENICIPAREREVKISIPITVTDIDSLMKVISDANEASIIPQDITIITAYDLNDNILSSLSVPVTLDFQECLLSPYIAPSSVERTADQPVYFNFMIPGIGSFANNFAYLISYYPKLSCFYFNNPVEVTIYIGDINKTKLQPSDFSVLFAHIPIIYIRIPHTDIMKNQPIYISIKGYVRPDINDFTSNIADSFISCSLIYFGHSSSEIVCNFEYYPLPTYLTEAAPHLQPF